MHPPIAIIIGPPRSGTSILGRVLDRHPRISTWIEPYYIWDHFFRAATDDELTDADATDKVRRWIRREFTYYGQAFDIDWIVDKSPRNCLKLPFVFKIFPEARFIIILRDGRDTILSILQQWQKKGQLFGASGGSGHQQEKFYIYRRWLNRRKLWRFRIKSILFELGPPKNWIKKNFLNQIRWGRRFGWGPRFKGWQEIIAKATPLEFSAYQWLHCAEGILNNINLLPVDRRIILKYEDFIEDPERSIERILQFMGMESPDRFMDMTPEIWAENKNKWRQGFSVRELNIIGPIIGQTLIEFGYEKDENWYQEV